MADMRDVIERLTERTEEQRVPWKATNDEDAFAATIGDMSVMISSQMVRRPRPDPRSEPMSLRIAVLDERWNEIAAFEAGRVSSRDFQKLYSLWQSAKMSATGAHPRLDEFLEALDAAPPVSSPPEPERERSGRRLFHPRQA